MSGMTWARRDGADDALDVAPAQRAQLSVWHAQRGVVADRGLDQVALDRRAIAQIIVRSGEPRSKLVSFSNAAARSFGLGPGDAALLAVGQLQRQVRAVIKLQDLAVIDQPIAGHDGADGIGRRRQDHPTACDLTGARAGGLGATGATTGGGATGVGVGGCTSPPSATAGRHRAGWPPSSRQEGSGRPRPESLRAGRRDMRGVGKRNASHLAAVELERDVIADDVLDDFAAVHRAIPGDHRALDRPGGLGGNRARLTCAIARRAPRKNASEEQPPQEMTH